jgi:two-component system, NtrC family, response regulator AtoC
MAATHNDLAEAVATRAFREDLYYRLNVLSMRVPPLRERPEDILPFAEFFLALHASPGVPVPPLTPDLREALLAHPWPGNVRELENIMRRLLVLRSPTLIVSELVMRGRRGRSSEFPAPLPASSAPVPNTFATPPVAPPMSLAATSGTAFVPFAAPKPTPEARPPIFERVNQAKNQAETEAILAALNSTRWNRKQASALLKIDYKALLYKMKKLAIEDQAGTSPFAD